MRRQGWWREWGRSQLGERVETWERNFAKAKTSEIQLRRRLAKAVVDNARLRGQFKTQERQMRRDRVFCGVALFAGVGAFVLGVILIAGALA